MKKTLLTLTTLLFSLIGSAQTFVVNYITYTVNSGSNVRTTDYDMAGGTAVNVPVTVTDPSTSTVYTVAFIGAQSFKNNNLTNVTLPSGIIDIGEQAFIGNDLTSITIPNTVTAIGPYAFSNNNLTAIDMPSSVTYMGSYLFRQNQFTDFSNVNFPNGVIPTGCFKSNQMTSAILPNTITSIGNEAFIGNQITNVALPTSLTTIGASAFESNQITTIDIPNSVTSIGKKAFLNNQLTSFTLPSTITSIPESMFYNNQLTSIVIPNNITSINKSAFRGNLLTSVTLPNGLVSIGEGAFLLNQITTIDIPNSVTSIGNASFQSNLLTNITIPENVTTIGPSAFKANPLTSVTSKNTTPPTIETGGSYDSFDQDRSTIDLIIPTGTMDAYVTDQNALWTSFNTVTEIDFIFVGIENEDIKNEVTVFFAKNSIEINTTNNTKLQRYMLYNLSGKIIEVGEENNITINGLEKGIYVLKMDFNKGALVQKIAIGN